MPRFVIINGRKHRVPLGLPPFKVKRGDVDYVPFTKERRNLSVQLTQCKLSPRDWHRRKWEYRPKGRKSSGVTTWREPTITELKAELARRGVTV